MGMLLKTTLLELHFDHYIHFRYILERVLLPNRTIISFKASADISELHEVHKSVDFEALTSLKVMSGMGSYIVKLSKTYMIPTISWLNL